MTLSDARTPLARHLVEALASPGTRLIAWIILFQVLFLVFRPSLGGPFLYDELTSIVNNADLREADGWRKVFGKHEHSLCFDRRPVAGLLTWANYQVGGLAPYGYRLANVLIHWLTAVLLGETMLLLARRWSLAGDAAPAISLAAAWLWALHPMAATPVLYVYARTESLATLFILLAIHAQARAVPGPGRRWLLLSMAAAALAMLSKEIAVSLLVLLPLVDRLSHAPSWRETWARRSGYYLILAGTFSLLLYYALSGARVGDIHLGQELSRPSEYAKAQCGIVLNYLRLMLWPDPIVFAPMPRPASAWIQWVAPAILLGFLAALGFRLACWRRWIWLPLLTFAAVLAPSSSVLPIPTETEADYRMYLPGACVIVLAVAGTLFLARFFAHGRRWLVAASFVLLLLLGATTHHRARLFANSASVWSDTVAKEPDNARAWANLGYVLIDQADYDRASQCATTVEQLAQRWQASTQLAIARHMQGLIFLGQKKPAEAIQPLRQAAEMHPAALEYRVDLAVAFLEIKQAVEARKMLEQVLQHRPEDARARAVWAKLEATKESS